MAKKRRGKGSQGEKKPQTAKQSLITTEKIVEVKPESTEGGS